MSDIVKVENGLIIPLGMPEEQIVAYGSVIGPAYNNAKDTLYVCQWVVGDWYNSMHKSDRADACKKYGVPVASAQKYARVVRRYRALSDDTEQAGRPVLPARSIGLNWTLHREAANGTTYDQCGELIKWATVGVEEPAGHFRPPTEEEMVAERKRRMGIVPVAKLKLSTDAEFDAALDNLPKNTSAKAKKEVRRVIEVARKQFRSEVRNAVDKGMEEDRARLREVHAKQVARDKHLDVMAARINFFMTEEEFKIVLGCLHPDREATKARKEKAFSIFNRLKAGLPKKAKWKDEGE
jgi:hypothetical protein